MDSLAHIKHTIRVGRIERQLAAVLAATVHEVAALADDNAEYAEALAEASRTMGEAYERIWRLRHQMIAEW